MLPPDQGVIEQEALQTGMEQKPGESTGKGNERFAKAQQLPLMTENPMRKIFLRCAPTASAPCS